MNKRQETRALNKHYKELAVNSKPETIKKVKAFVEWYSKHHGFNRLLLLDLIKKNKMCGLIHRDVALEFYQANSESIIEWVKRTSGKDKAEFSKYDDQPLTEGEVAALIKADNLNNDEIENLANHVVWSLSKYISNYYDDFLKSYNQQLAA